jgi:hypothetical protein
MLFALPKPKHSLLHLREDSTNGSIEMVYQGSMKTIESESSEAQATSSSDTHTQEEQTQTVSGLTTPTSTCAECFDTGPAATR